MDQLISEQRALSDNQFYELEDFNLITSDLVVQNFLEKNGLLWMKHELIQLGQQLGKKERHLQAEQVNRHDPTLHVFDTRGQRVNYLEFHPHWHSLLALARKNGIITRAFEDEKEGRWVLASIGFYLHAQIESGTLCPATMTQAAVPILQKELRLWNVIGKKLLSRKYDARDVPIDEKDSIWIGMGMTEKQGGSDLRANVTSASRTDELYEGYPVFELAGHKWFFSAPMSDAHLVLARMEESGQLACFFVPRFKPNGTRNTIQIQKIKSKIGNRSNSSVEVEFDGAWAIPLGEEGRGVATIIEMASYTRLNCVIGSTGILRQAAVQSIAYARQRKAFGTTLYEKQAMRNTLCDFAIESEAATLTALHLAQCYETKASNPTSEAWQRIITPAAKFWICKRAIAYSAESMEVFGGNGYMNESMIARSYLEAPVNSIWEGSGNIMCLDVLRAYQKEARLFQILFEDFIRQAMEDQRLLLEIDNFQQWLSKSEKANLEGKARYLCERLIQLAQACLLKQYAPSYVYSYYFNAHFTQYFHGESIGALNEQDIPHQKILERCIPLFNH